VLRWSRSLDDVECVIAPGQVSRLAGVGTRCHFHREMELAFFTHGEGTRFIGDHIGQFSAGDLVMLGEKLPHHWHTCGTSSGILVQWHFPQSHPFWGFPENQHLGGLFNAAGQGLQIKGRTAHEVASLMKRLPERHGPSQLALFFEILDLLGKAPMAERGKLSTKSFALGQGTEHEQAIDLAMQYLLAHFREEIRLEDLLKLTDMSKATFSRQFVKHSGHTFSECTTRLRLEAACRDLQASERSVLDIALACGFTQLSFFNRVFRRAMKCCPSEFRANARRGSGSVPH
jgi:AraC-like DNA-binding protein